MWRQRVLVVLVFVVTGLAVVLGVMAAPKTYTASAVLQATENTEQPTTENLDSLRGTLAELASSTSVVQQVRDELSVPRDVDELRRSISAEWVEGTVLIQITATDSSPVVSAEIAQTTAMVLQNNDPSGNGFSFTITTSAAPPATYSSPNLLLAIGAGLVLALVLAAFAAALRDRRRSTVDSARVAEDAAGAPLLAHVSPPRDPTSLPALYPGTASADPFRQLRLALEAEASESPVDRVVVASIGGGEINVWLGANLAISLAKVGRKVLLVDGRLRARTGQPLADEPDTEGLYEVLRGVELDEALSSGPVDGLTVLPAGNAGGEPAEVLIETHFAEVMALARERFDVIVVLAPPMDVCDDARVMAAGGGSLLLALPQGSVSVATLRTYSDRVRSVGARMLGIVLVGRRVERTPVV